MGRKVQLNYDELRTVVKKFRNEGEDTVQMRSTLRDRVRELHKDWVGESANKFFSEMENDLLPALSRLASALFFAQDVLDKIIKTIQNFDEDTAGYFKGDFAHVNPINLGVSMAGAGIVAGIGSMAGGSLSGRLSGAGGSGVGGSLGGGIPGVGTGESISGTDEPFPNSQAGSGQIGSVDQTPGAGGGSSSQGLQGNLQGTGGVVGSQVGGGTGGGSMGGGSNTPDHVYGVASGVRAGGSSAQTTQAAVSGGSGTQGSAGGGTAAAGAASVAGSAAIGGAGKSIKGRSRKKKR